MEVYLKEVNPEAFLMLQSGMTGTWAMIGVREREGTIRKE